MKRIGLAWLSLWSFVGGANAGERFLFQIHLTTFQERSQVAASGLVPYALMRSSVIAEGTANEAEPSGLRYKTLLSAPARGNFYLILPPFGKPPSEVRSQVAQSCEILTEDSDAFFVRAEPEDAERLLSGQFHLVRVWMKPIDLGLSIPVEPPRVATYNPVIQWVIDQITVSEISEMLRELTGERPVIVRGRPDTIRTRDARMAKNSTAVWYFYERASSYTGLDSVAFHSYAWYGGVDSNVVATKVGRVYPRRQYIMGGHIDCISEQSRSLAPGADDNGSGTIAALIAAKVMRQIPFMRTVKLMAFNTEEYDFGSRRYASEARVRGDSILGVLNGDMIATNYTGNDSLLVDHGDRAGSIPLADRFYQIDTTYNLGLRIFRSSGWSGSDHIAFWDYGYEAIGVHENDFSNYYHTSNDRITALDTIYWTKVVKCMVATLCDLAEPDTFFIGVEEPPTPQLTNSTRPLSVSPNPFILFAAVPGHSSERFSLYDVSGRKIGICKGDRVGEGLGPGVYFLRPEGENTKPLRVVKVR